MLQSLLLEGFKAYGGGAVGLRPFTVLIGPNGAGKTTLMQAIDVLGWLVKGDIANLMEAKGWEYGDLPHLRAPTKSFSITAQLRLSGERVTWELGLGARRRPGISHERVIVGGSPPNGSPAGTAGRIVMDRRGRTMSRTDESGEVDKITQTLTSSWLSAVGNEDKHRFPWLVALADWARRIRGYFFLDPLKLRAPSRSGGDEIGVNGENLAPFLARLRDRDRAAFERVQTRVRKHYPRLVELRAVRQKYGWTQLEVTERWDGETATFNARQVSDGLLRLVAVAAMQELPVAPSVLLLDEVENGLHPHLLGGFVRMLQELAKSATQVILATHSPITLNFCQSPDDIVLVTRGRGGLPHCQALSQTKGFERLREHFELGELWYNVGERELTK